MGVQAERGVTSGITPTFVGSCWLATGLVSGRAGAAELLADVDLAHVAAAVFTGIGVQTSVCRCRRAVHLHEWLLSELQLLVF